MAAPILQFDDFELDRSAYQLRRSGFVVHLERIPLDLLFLLAERRGELVSREEILERVWGKGVFIDVDAAINAAVRKVRRALNDSVDAPRFVVTVPARGYRFLAQIQGEKEERPTPPIPEGAPVSEITPAPEGAPIPELAPVIVADQPPALQRRRQGWLWIAGLAVAALGVLLAWHPFPRPLAHSAIDAPPTIALLGQNAPTGPATAPPPLPNIPSIAVLPFANLSGDPQQEYFSDGISDQLITDLSRLPNLFVIARASSFTYKKRAAKVQDIGRELGVKYLLEGSVLKAGNRMRIATHLVDAGSGADLWAERFDRPLVDIFALQDDIVEKIVTTLNLQFGLRQRGILVNQDTDSLQAYDDFLQATAYIWSYSKDGNAKARQFFRKAVEADSRYCDAYVGLGATYWLDWIFQWHPDASTLDQAFQNIRKALVLNDSHPIAHSFYGRLLVCKRQYGMAISESERAIDLAPYIANTYFMAAETLSLSGKPAEAIELSRKAMRLDPINQDWYLMQIGTAYLNMRRYRDAIPPLERFLVAYPGHVGGRFVLVMAYALSGMKPQAQSEAAELMRQSQSFSLSQFKDLSDRELAVLHQAGLK